MRKREDDACNVVGGTVVARAPSSFASRHVAVAAVAGAVLLRAGSAAEPGSSVWEAGLRLRRRFLSG